MPDTFSKANLLNEYIRGFDAGTCCAAGVMLAFFFRTIPAKTAIAALLVYVFLLTIAVGTFLADYLLITDCYLRVKLIYTAVLLHNLSFWVFQADLTHTVTSGISSSVPGTKYIILGTLLYQCTEACYVVYCYEPKVDSNEVCQVTLDPNIFMLDKVSEVIFSMVVAGLFLYPLFLGARDLEVMASSSSKTPHRKDSTTTRNISSPPSTHAVNLEPLVAGKLRLIRIIRHRGFILVLSLMVKAINIICVLTSEHPSILTTWNVFFMSEYTLLMTVHICSTFETVPVKLTKPNGTKNSQQKSAALSLAHSSKSSAMSMPVDEYGLPGASSRHSALSALSPGADAFSKANLLNEYIRGFDAGACCAAGVMLAFFFRTVPIKTAIAALLVYVFLLTIAAGTFLADYLLITDCYLRVKLIYTAVLLHNASFWVFQADLTHTVTSGISSSVPGTQYIILGILLYQCTEACYVVYRYEPRVDPNQVCHVTLDPKIFMLDKFSEVIFSMVVAGLFLYPLFLGARDLEVMASSTNRAPQRKDSTLTRHLSYTPSSNAVHVEPFVAGKLRLTRIIRHRGFVLVLSMMVKTINIICVLTSEDPSMLTTWNVFFMSEHTLLMTIHICSTLEATPTKLLKRAKAGKSSHQKSIAHSFAKSSKSSAMSLPLDELAIVGGLAMSPRASAQVSLSPGPASLPRRFEGDRHGPLDILKE
ncbi:hypothetical protein HDU78_008731 [Chytriomyces hyalinus]|nr:hypothetical protein HDU78_008731 [Chytriomyces hyalinus]